MRRRLCSPDYRVTLVSIEKFIIDLDTKIQDKIGPKKNKLATALLAIFLGGIGAHKFYLGGKRRTELGLIYLLLFWTGVPALVGLIEGILFLIMPEKKFQEELIGA